MSKFIVFYTGFNHSGNPIHGHCTVECACFPSYNKTQSKLKEQHDYIDKVSITNVIEVTPKQFDEWISPLKS